MPINTSKLADTALATVVGFKHLKSQAESNLLSAENNLSTSIVQEAQAKKEHTDALGDAAKFENANPNLSDEDALNQEEIEKLKEQDDELSKKMSEEHPRNEQGRFISKMDHQREVAKQQSKVNQDLEMARKARDVINNKLIARKQLGDNVKARETQLGEAQLKTERARDYLAKAQKETKWLVGGNK